MASQRRQLAAGPPDRLGVDDQARLVRGLQSEPDLPVLAVPDRLHEPETRPNRARDGVLLPAAEHRRERVHRRRVGDERALGTGQRRQPGSGRRVRRHRPMVSRVEPRAARAAASTRVSKASAHRANRSPSCGRRHRWRHRRGQDAGPGGVGAGEDRTPQGTRRIVEHHRQQASPPDQVGREPGHLSQVGDRGPSTPQPPGRAPAARRKPGRHRARAREPATLRGCTSPVAWLISSRTSSGELSGPPPRVGSVERCGACRGLGGDRGQQRGDVGMRRRVRMRSDTGRPARSPRRCRRPGGVLTPDPERARSRRGRVPQPAGVKHEHLDSSAIPAGPITFSMPGNRPCCLGRPFAAARLGRLPP